jgi:hypothetical protein
MMAGMTSRTKGQIAWGVGLALVAVVVGTAVLQRVALRHDRRALAALDAAEPAVRRQAAMIVAAEYTPAARARLAAGLREEPDAAVREAGVYALGRRGTAGDFAVVADLARGDEDGYVRYRAWWAAARLDGAGFARLVDAHAGGDGWDAIGQAYGRLEMGDVSGAETLLHWAESGTAAQRGAASQALYHTLAPLLEAAGRWPIEQAVGLGDVWPAALVAEVRARCATMDLAAVAADARQAFEEQADIQARAGKLERAEGRLAWLLGLD